MAKLTFSNHRGNTLSQPGTENPTANNYPKRFLNKVAIITGASDGIGKTTALLMAREGAKLILNARRPDLLEATAQEVALQGEAPIVVAGDICEKVTVDTVVDQALQQHGQLDILINNAGGSTPVRDLESITPEEWYKTLESNLSSIFFCCQKAASVMKPQGYGRIVNLTSLAGRSRTTIAGPQYTASKAGVIGLTRHLAGILGAFGITVNSVAPGVTLTGRVKERWEGLSDLERQEVLSAIPLRRLGTPEDVVPAIAFLASEEARYITGAVLDVNGGRLMC